MSDTKFTPGPWRIDDCGDVRSTEDGEVIAVVLSDTDEFKTASLIAAAPELYEASAPFDELATQRVVHSPEWRDSDTITVVVSIRALRAIKAARAKARGDA